MYNFRTGGGKSPSFFFFPDNNKLMLKTLKESESEIMFSKGFLLEYFKFILKNPETLLMKIFGVYELQIGKSKPISFILTDNMVGLDYDRVLRAFDLKGSIHGRLERVTEKQLMEGTGLKALKDQNFLALNQIEKVIQIDDDKRQQILDQMDRDSQFLKSHALIDYSVFLIQVDRNKIIQNIKDRMPELTFDPETGFFNVTMGQAVS